MRSGECYATPFECPYFMLIPKRRFFTPWVWDLRGVRTPMSNSPVGPIEDIASNLRRHEVVGLLKLFNAYNIGE